MDNRQDGAADAADREAQAREPNPPVKTSADMAAGDKSPGSAANAATMNDGANGGLMDESDAVLEERADLGIVDPDSGQPLSAGADAADRWPSMDRQAAEAQIDGRRASEPSDRSSARPLGGTAEAAQTAQEVAARAPMDAQAKIGHPAVSALSAPAHAVGTVLDVEPEDAHANLKPVAVDERGRVWRVDDGADKVRLTLVGRLVS